MSNSPSLSGLSYAKRGEDVGGSCCIRRRHLHPQCSWHQVKKFKEGEKSPSFLTSEGTYEETNKFLRFIQQFDVPFGGAKFIKASKL